MGYELEQILNNWSLPQLLVLLLVLQNVLLRLRAFVATTYGK